MIQTINAPMIAPLLFPLPPRMSIAQMMKVPNRGVKTLGWMARTDGGQKATKYGDIDYYAIFPDNTRMLFGSEEAG